MLKKARRCYHAHSPGDWVHQVFLTCDNMLAVQFNRHMKEHRIAPHGPGAFAGHGGIPGPCCLYPATQGELAEQLYDLGLVWTYAGEWVRRFLYRKFDYVLIPPPEGCGGCNMTCSLQIDPGAPQAGQVVKETKEVGTRSHCLTTAFPNGRDRSGEVGSC